MGVFDFLNKNKVEYDIVSDNGVNIKKLNDGKTKYVISGSVARQIANAHNKGNLMDILQDGTPVLHLSYKTREYDGYYSNRVGEYYKKQDQHLLIQKENVSDFSVSKSFLGSPTVTFTLDDNAKTYCSGHEYICCTEDMAETYKCKDENPLSKDNFDTMLTSMGTLHFFDSLDSDKLIEIPKDLGNKLHVRFDEFNVPIIYFENSGNLTICGTKVEKDDKVFFKPAGLQFSMLGDTFEDYIHDWVKEEREREKDRKNEENLKGLEKPKEDKKLFDVKVQEQEDVIVVTIPKFKMQEKNKVSLVLKDKGQNKEQEIDLSAGK